MDTSSERQLLIYQGESIVVEAEKILLDIIQNLPDAFLREHPELTLLSSPETQSTPSDARSLPSSSEAQLIPSDVRKSDLAKVSEMKRYKGSYKSLDMDSLSEQSQDEIDRYIRNLRRVILRSDNERKGALKDKLNILLDHKENRIKRGEWLR